MSETRGWLERLFNNPSAVMALVLAVVGQALFTGYYQVRHNERVNEEMRHQAELHQQLDKRIEDLNRGGTSQMALVIERQSTNIASISKLNDRLNNLEMLRTQIEIMKVTLSRLEDQQMRMLQALDNTYNTVQELARERGPARKPMPNEGKP